MHRWVWDLHYAAPDATRHDYPISAIPGDTPRHPLGPTALPGSYTARLTANGKTYSASFTVRMDPRVQVSPTALEKKLQAEMRLSDLLSQTSKAVRQARALRDQLQKLIQQGIGSAGDSVQAFQSKLKDLLGAPGGFLAPPSQEVTLTRVSGQAATLYNQVWQVDAEPTVTQTEAASILDREAAGVMQRWNTLRTSDLQRLNRALQGAGLPEMKIEADPQQDEDAGDEE